VNKGGNQQVGNVGVQASGGESRSIGIGNNINEDGTQKVDAVNVNLNGM